MNIIFQGSEPKEPALPQANEDRYAFSSDLTKFVLCDGASESYNAKLWADIISRNFISDSSLNNRWLEKTVKEYIAEHDFNAMGWSQLSSFQRGSFATLASLEVDHAVKTIKVRIIGDSFIYFFRKNGERLTYLDAFEIPDFSTGPTLLATNLKLNESIDFNETCREIEIDEDGKIIALCMTDALAALFERAMKENCHEILIRIFYKIGAGDFAELVALLRREGFLKIDDTTLVVLEI